MNALNNRLNRDWRELISVDFPPYKPITEETRREIVKYANRYRTDVRLALGIFPIDEEYEQRRRRVLSTPSLNNLILPKPLKETFLFTKTC